MRHTKLSLALALCLLPTGLQTNPAAASELIDGCSVAEPHESVTFLLIDRTDSDQPADNLKQSFTALKQSIKPGERLVVGYLGAKASEAKIVADFTKPQQSMWESVMKIRAKEKVFNDCLEKTQAAALTPPAPTKTSAILETLGFVSSALGLDNSKDKRVVIFSDMVQNSEAVSFYHGKDFNPDATTKTVEAKQLISKFEKIKVSIAEIGARFTDERAKKVETFWRNYFEKSGALLDYYGPVLLLKQ